LRIINLNPMRGQEGANSGTFELALTWPTWFVLLAVVAWATIFAAGTLDRSVGDEGVAQTIAVVRVLPAAPQEGMCKQHGRHQVDQKYVHSPALSIIFVVYRLLGQAGGTQNRQNRQTRVSGVGSSRRSV
jgi:hypothetical protein